MQDIGGLIGAVVGALGAIGGGVAWLVRRRDSKKDPIPKESAAVALAQSGVALMQGVADRLEGDIGDLRNEVASQRDEIGDLRGDLHSLRVTLGAAARYIERLLHWAKSESRPPVPPLPVELRDLIDPALHD